MPRHFLHVLLSSCFELFSEIFRVDCKTGNAHIFEKDTGCNDLSLFQHYLSTLDLCFVLCDPLSMQTERDTDPFEFAELFVL